LDGRERLPNVRGQTRAEQGAFELRPGRAERVTATLSDMVAEILNSADSRRPTDYLRLLVGRILFVESQPGARDLQRFHHFARYCRDVWGTVFGGCRRESGRRPASGHHRRRLPALSRVPLFSRNAFRLPTIVNVDLRISRRFRIANKATLEILGEAFNLLNRTQVTELNTRMYVTGGTATASTLTFDPAFQTVSAAGNNVVRERQLQFAIRLEF
jgi:hypothetical protein